MSADRPATVAPEAPAPSTTGRTRRTGALTLAVARLNRGVLNPVLGPAAARLPGMGVVHHIGRRTGRSFTTPVRVFRSLDAFYVMVAPGRTPDWLRNLEAAGGGELRVGGRLVRIGRPRPADASEALAAASTFSTAWRKALGLTTFVALAPARPGIDATVS
jgi:deazaflavin-dependent oxidoreductase (nitroreductase family)